MKRLSTCILKAIGTEVRRRRTSAGYTIECLAERASMHKNYLGRVELGQADFSISALWSIALALDCELLDLFPSTRHPISPDVLAAARMFSKADQEVRDAVMAVLARVPSTRRRSTGSAGE
jgi:transcriptional regulator with XRE-family HTH domain